MHAPEVNDYIKHKAVKLDQVSDEIDEVNVLKLKQKDAVEKTQAEIDYDLASKFDQEKGQGCFQAVRGSLRPCQELLRCKSSVTTCHYL